MAVASQGGRVETRHSRCRGRSDWQAGESCAASAAVAVPVHNVGAGVAHYGCCRQGAAGHYLGGPHGGCSPPAGTDDGGSEVGRIFLRVTLIAAVIATAALAMAGLGPGLAHADPNKTCTPPQWVTDWSVPIGSRL